MAADDGLGPCPSLGHGLGAAAASALLAAADHVDQAWAGASPREAATRLSLHAEDLAHSPVARDQLLSRALELAAGDLSEGRRPLTHWPLFFAEDMTPSLEAREDVRAWVLASADSMLADGEAVAEAVEARAVRALGDAFETARGLTRRLRVEAWLQLALWDDPRIPANAETRFLMRAGGRRLMARVGD